MMSRKRFDYWKNEMNERAAYTIMLGALLRRRFRAEP
jgi:hypothetical protein